MPDKPAKQTHHHFHLSNWLSGATIFSIILNNHRQITCNGETLPFADQNADELVCSCSHTLTHCEFYNYAANHFIENGKFNQKYFSRIPVIFNNSTLQKIFNSYYHPHLRDIVCRSIPGFRKNISYFIDAQEKFFDRACNYDKTSIYLDGVKSPRRVELFAQYSNKPVKVLHTVRDGRKFVASSIKAYNLTDAQITSTAHDWVSYNNMVELLQKRYPDIQFKEVRHEDLCKDKEMTIRDICDFLEIDYDENIFNFDDSTYHILGNNMRKKFDGTIYENNSWKSVYDDALMNKVTQIQKKYLKKYNYL